MQKNVTKIFVMVIIFTLIFLLLFIFFMQAYNTSNNAFRCKTFYFVGINKSNNLEALETAKSFEKQKGAGVVYSKENVCFVVAFGYTNKEIAQTIASNNNLQVYELNIPKVNKNVLGQKKYSGVLDFVSNFDEFVLDLYNVCIELEKGEIQSQDAVINISKLIMILENYINGEYNNPFEFEDFLTKTIDNAKNIIDANILNLNTLIYLKKFYVNFIFDYAFFVNKIDEE